MNAEQGIVTGVSVSHTDATLEQLEAAAFDSDGAVVEALLEKDGIREAFVLQTCNRVEAYTVSERATRGQKALGTVFSDVDSDVVREMEHEESIRHLLRVAAGLESLVIGEDQILGQVREAYETARDAGGIGSVLDDAVTKAIRVGERARTETSINEGVVSIASAAVKLVEETHGLHDTGAVVVGTGEMGTVAAKRLAGRVDELVIVNRTVERAERLEETLNAGDTAIETTGLDGLPGTLAPRDIVISATGSRERILDPTACEELEETFVIDITRPRDIPPAADGMDHLTVYDLDRLESVTEKTRQMRRQAARKVESLIEEEFSRLLVQYKRKRADTVISAMYESAERIKARELETTLEKADFDEEQKAAIEALADSLVNQLLAPPTNSLRDAAEEDDWSTIHTALQLFDPNFEAEVPPMLQEADYDDIPEGVRDQLPDSDFGNSDD